MLRMSDTLCFLAFVTKPTARKHGVSVILNICESSFQMKLLLSMATWFLELIS